jgi:hypothetical protein
VMGSSTVCLTMITAADSIGARLYRTVIVKIMTYHKYLHTLTGLQTGGLSEARNELFHVGKDINCSPSTLDRRGAGKYQYAGHYEQQ